MTDCKKNRTHRTVLQAARIKRNIASAHSASTLLIFLHVLCGFLLYLFTRHQSYFATTKTIKICSGNQQHIFKHTTLAYGELCLWTAKTTHTHTHAHNGIPGIEQQRWENVVTISRPMDCRVFFIYSSVSIIFFFFVSTLTSNHSHSWLATNVQNAKYWTSTYASVCIPCMCVYVGFPHVSACYYMWATKKLRYTIWLANAQTEKKEDEQQKTVSVCAHKNGMSGFLMCAGCVWYVKCLFFFRKINQPHND